MRSFLPPLTKMSCCSLSPSVIPDVAAPSALGPRDRLLNLRTACGVRLYRAQKATKLSERRGGKYQLNAFVGSQSGVVEDEDEDEDDLCPVDCVREFKTEEEFSRILEKAKAAGSLVVVDFYRTSCGSCKYIEQGFAKLCKGSGDGRADVVFLKHNVIDEYDEQSEVADRLRIRAVPLFHFYKNGVLLEAFPTRDKERIIAAILRYTSSA